MDAKKYVNAIVGKIRCNGKKKKEIKKQLLMDINMRMKQGEQLEDIILQMGTAKEIADGFNENISPKEQKRYVKNKVLKIIIPIIIVLILLILFVYWMLPKSFDIEQSKYFKIVISSVILLVSVTPIIIIGIVQCNSKEPVGFWSGKKPPKEEQIIDVKAYNQKHGLMWILLGAGFILCFVCRLF